MKEHILVLCVAFVLDLLFGDPLWLWHPVQGIGKIIEVTDQVLRSLFRIKEEREQDKWKKRIAGIILVIVVLGITTGIYLGIYFVTGHVHKVLQIIFECVICYQMLAMKSLKKESMYVYQEMSCAKNQKERLEKGRNAVGRIVGRDTAQLSEEGIIKATVETVAENTSDGEIAPMFYMFIFGPLGALIYKTINTMDSMIGYKNDRYRYMGTLAARLDDVVNFIPARISALLMIGVSFLLGYNGTQAMKIYLRDRYNHASPNSAQTESVCAGALGLQLAGPASYFGQIHHKPYIGDPVRRIELKDVIRVNRLLYGTGFVAFAIGIAICVFVLAFQS